MEAKGKKANSVRNLESILTNERENHKSEIHMLNSLIQQKDASIREMKKELEQRPKMELVDQMRQQLTVLLARISEKLNLLEAAEKKITELNEEVVKREKLLTEIETEIEDALILILGDDSAELKNLLSVSDQKNIQVTNVTEVSEESVSLTVPTVPVTKKLIFFNSKESNYDLDDLLNSSAEVLGKGTFGATYKTKLQNGLTLVVKRLRQVQLPEMEFRQGIVKIGELQHEHLMPLNAYYFSMDEKLLVYDFATSLSDVLHGSETSNKVPLNWASRANIALTSARAISHIHSLSPFSSHGNVKSSNILLKSQNPKPYQALISDTGLFFLASPIPSRIKTLNRAPEITDPTKPSQKADVYSFGVLLLELLTGRGPSQEVNIVKWVQSELKDGWVHQVIDEGLLRDQSVSEEELVEFLQIAIDCTEQFPALRPLMHVVEARIEAIVK